MVRKYYEERIRKDVPSIRGNAFELASEWRAGSDFFAKPHPIFTGPAAQAAADAKAKADRDAQAALTARYPRTPNPRNAKRHAKRLAQGKTH